VGWSGTLGVADASLWPMGLLCRLVVLDSRTRMGARMGVVGLCAGIRQLVPTRLEQSRGPGIWIQLWLRPVARVDGRPSWPFRRRVRSRELRGWVWLQSPDARRVRAALRGSAGDWIRGPTVLVADSRARRDETSRSLIDRIHQPHAERLAGRRRRQPRHRWPGEKRPRAGTVHLVELCAVRPHANTGRSSGIAVGDGWELPRVRRTGDGRSKRECVPSGDSAS